MVHHFLLRCSHDVRFKRSHHTGVLLERFEQVTISVKGDLDRVVTHPSLHSFGDNSLLDPQAGTCVAEIVKGEEAFQDRLSRLIEERPAAAQTWFSQPCADLGGLKKAEHKVCMKDWSRRIAWEHKVEMRWLAA